MNILILADGDWSGAGNALFNAINEYTEHSARQVAYLRSYLDYPCDVFMPTVAELRDLWQWADVVNVHDNAHFRRPKGTDQRPIIKTYHGSEYRMRWVYYNQIDKQHDYISTALNLDLAMLGPRWIGRAVPDMTDLRNGRRSNGTFRVAHAPTNRGIKDTETVIGALDALPGVELVLIEGVANKECIEIKATCDLLVEEFKLGYGTNAIENWAMSIPVIAHANGPIMSTMKMRLGKLPFVDTPLENLRDTVAHLRDSKSAYNAARRKGRAYWKKYHHPAVVATQFIDLCEELV